MKTLAVRDESKELARRVDVDALHAGRTSRYDHTSPALCDRRWLVYETTEVVAADFLL
jgi:hypothetical protein